jgi:antirestriction protein ArdC
MSNQVYGYITDKILEELERGCVPWHQPWKSPDGVRVPTSFVSKKPYRGVNTFLLAVSRVKAGYSSNYWLTFKQIQALGGSVKGQHSEMIVFWKVLEKPAENPTPENEKDFIPMLRYYRMFNPRSSDGHQETDARESRILPDYTKNFILGLTFSHSVPSI